INCGKNWPEPERSGKNKTATGKFISKKRFSPDICLPVLFIWQNFLKIQLLKFRAKCIIILNRIKKG
ncbi:hypothetical protein, partial [Heyndrickxia coagulans]|uniref:hypothetical protein n=1 Tax=Heyndrickxia coagulans TaxID=1398 RepID=UPI001BE49201